MSKYSEALEEVLENGGYLDNGKDDYKAPRLLKEAIKKAEKYDELIADNKVLTKLVWLKYGTSLNDKTAESLLDKYEEECHYMFAEKEKTLVENKILKEGINAILKEIVLSYSENLECYNMTFKNVGLDGLDDCDMSDNDKIKAMLEVIEDERKDKSIHKKDI